MRHTVMTPRRRAPDSTRPSAPLAGRFECPPVTRSAPAVGGRAIIARTLLALACFLPGLAHAQEQPVVEGQLVDRRGQGIGGAQITLTVFTPAGERLFSRTVRTDSSGQFTIELSELPVANLVQPSYAAVLAADADGYRARTQEAIVNRDPDGVVSVTPRTFALQLESISRWTTLLLLFPALVGGFLALYHFYSYSTAKGRRRFVWFYSFFVLLSWSLVVARLLFRYVQYEETYIPLMFPDFAVPFAVIVASFLGTITYVAYSVFSRNPDFFAPENAKVREKVLLVMGGRLLVSPYITLIGYGILAVSFPVLNTGPFALFFGFFAGLWIKVVLEMLDDVGKRFLSEEARQKLVKQLSASEAPKGRTAGGWVSAGPSSGLLQLVGERSEYIVQGQVYTLPVDRSRIAIRFAPAVDEKQQLRLAQRLGIVRDEALDDPDANYTFWIVTDDSREGYRRVVEAAGASEGVVRVAPVFKSENGGRSIATDKIILVLQPQHITVPKAVKRVLKTFKATEVPDPDPKASEPDNEFVYRVGEKEDPFQAADALNAVDEVEYAEVDLVHMAAATCADTPLEPLYPPEKAFAVCKEANKDKVERQNRESFKGGYVYSKIKVTNAWKTVKALTDRAEITIAVLDDGVDVRHPDFASVKNDQFDACDDAPNLRRLPQPHDAHGTACAGLATANPGENKDGMRGIGMGCKLLAVRVNYRSLPKKDAPVTTSNSRIKRGIQWAVENGADVLSLSWRTQSSFTVKKALRTALKAGRNGKGCVVVAAAGNDGGAVAFPANLQDESSANPVGVLAVAATDADDKPASRPNWSSNAGPEVDLAAPGVDIFTTDLTGEEGWGKCDYLFDFDGTSAATAIVAGAAGLMLQANPALTGADVCHILINTAEKVGTVRYDARGHSNTLGYGRLDVEAAVRRAAESTNGTPNEA